MTDRITNGDFETGDWTGWTTDRWSHYIDSVSAYNSNYGLHIREQSNFYSTWCDAFDFTNVSELTFRINIVSSGVASGIFVRLDYKYGSTIWSKTTNLTDGYELITVDVTAITGFHEVHFCGWGQGPTFIAYIDNVSALVSVATITGTVKSLSGIPLSGATVTIDTTEATTDGDGEYSITVAPGTYEMTVEYPMLKTISQTLSVSADMTQDMTLYKVETRRKFAGRGASLEGGIECGRGKR